MQTIIGQIVKYIYCQKKGRLCFCNFLSYHSTNQNTNTYEVFLSYLWSH